MNSTNPADARPYTKAPNRSKGIKDCEKRASGPSLKILNSGNNNANAATKQPTNTAEMRAETFVFRSFFKSY